MNSGADSLARLNDLFSASAPGSSLFALILRALLLLLLLVAGAWFLRRLMRQRLRSGGAVRPMEVLSALPLGQRRQAVLLRVSDRVLLLGLGEGGIRTLGRFHGEEASDLLRAAGREPGSFRLKLDEALTEQPDA